MHFPEYARWLKGEVDKVVLENESISIGPFATPTVQPNKAPWDMEWTVLFKDGHYFRIVEHWYRRSSSLGGGGYRKTFSFHYGPTNPDRDSDGIPLHSAAYPAIIRIDMDDDWRGPHLHFKGEDHIRQARVRNLRISDVEPFVFIRAVLEYRNTSKGLDEIIGFWVTK